MDKTTTDLSAVVTIGLNLAKHVFQVHAIDAAGRVVMSRALRRKDVLSFFERLPSCLIGMEACGSAHHWARELMKFGHGEERNIVLESLFLLALVNLHRGLAVAHNAKAGITDRRQHLVNQFQERLDRHVNAIRSVAEYADMLSVTPTHLSRTVKSITGRTAGEIIHDRVMLEAKRQLVFTDTSISEIAYALKFSTPSYFTRFFSMQTGENPRSFRRRMRTPTPTLGK